MNLRSWWENTKFSLYVNREYAVLIKHVLMLFGFMTFTLVSFWYLNNAQDTQACRDRNTNRTELKKTLLHIVDLSDLLIDSPLGKLYTNNRSDYINNNPALVLLDC